MPTFSEISNEISAALSAKDPAAFDSVRRKYLRMLSEHTGRHTILYASKWTQAVAAPPGLISITREDIQGLMEVVHGLPPSSPVDIILHSPGGEPEATEAIVNYLRSKFSHIRVFIPQAAMSAATMLACAADEIVMGKHSSLGPIDPQLILQTANGLMMVPAQAILDQFDLAQDECKDPSKMGAWIPMLGQYGPALLVQCLNALRLSEHLVATWLRTWMLKSNAASEKTAASSRARKIAQKLNNHSTFMSHGRHISREDAKRMGLQVTDLESDQAMQDLVLSVFHAATLTFDATILVKIIENDQGRFFGKVFRTAVGPFPAPT